MRVPACRRTPAPRPRRGSVEESGKVRAVCVSVTSTLLFPGCRGTNPPSFTPSLQFSVNARRSERCAPRDVFSCAFPRLPPPLLSLESDTQPSLQARRDGEIKDSRVSDLNELDLLAVLFCFQARALDVSSESTNYKQRWFNYSSGPIVSVCFRSRIADHVLLLRLLAEEAVSPRW